MTVKHTVSDQWLIVHGKTIEDVLQRAVRQALLAHKRTGNPVASWHDEQVVILPPAAIPVTEDQDGLCRPPSGA